jgi:fatty acid desaturase
LRFHAIHHLLPKLPYYALPQAHRRIMRRIPEDSPLRATIQPSLFSALYQLFCGPRDTADLGQSGRPRTTIGI